MKRTTLLLISIISLLPFIASSQNKPKGESDKEIMAAKQVLMRVVGMKSTSFEFEKIPDENGLDVYEVIALGGKVLVKGSGTIAMTRGAYDYMNKACNVQYTWSTDQVTLPKVLPDYTISRTVTPYKYRQYYNVCTSGYSTAYWHFSDWEKELDWMALHGINMPLAMQGQEAIWQKVYKDMGMTNEELSAFFTGPSFLPWQRMGNVYKHNGPLPQSYIDQSLELQKQIMTRMRQLGMQPIVPGFSGIVPLAYKRLNPAATLREMKGWCNFPGEYEAFILSPGTTDFTTIGKNFITEYKRNYGEVNFYLADLFNENQVPVSGSNRDNELATYGKSVYDAIAAGDADGVWVMQGWMFYNNEGFWDKNAVKALLSQVPDDKMMIIDLANESFAGWKKLDAFSGKPWIYSVINNYGGNSQFSGDLPFLATDPAQMLASSKKGKITGFGISPEGIENNEVVYELLTQMAWTNKPLDIKTYIPVFSRQRYGTADADLENAWLNLLGSVYSKKTEHALNLYQARPPYSSKINVTDDQAFDQAVATFVKLAEKYKTNQLFKNDLVQLVIQYTGNKTDILLKRAIELHKLGEMSESKRAFGNAFELMVMMDALATTLPDQKLERLIENARKYGTNKEESDYYEADAKRQLTQWGFASTPVLHEYASKVWSGLIRDYYLGRWMAYAKALQSGNTVNFDEWENNWITTSGTLSKGPTTGDPIKYAITVYKAANEYVLNNLPLVKTELAYKGNNKVQVTLIPASDSLSVAFTTNGTKPGFGSEKYLKPFEVSLPATVKAIGYNKKSLYGDAAILKIPVSFGKPVTISPQPPEKYKAKFGSTLVDGITSNGGFNDGTWLGYEGVNFSAAVNLEGKHTVSKLSFIYLEDADNLIFAPNSVMIETSMDGVTYKPAGVHEFNEKNWSTIQKMNEITVAFKETEAMYVRVFFFARVTCPANHHAAGKKAWTFVNELTVE